MKVTPKKSITKKRRGRPPLFASTRDFKKKADEYFKVTKRPNMTGLALHLGITKQSLHDYSRKEIFSDLIMEARLRCENFLIDAGLAGKTNPRITEFILKNHHNYFDKNQVEIHGDVIHSLEVLIDEKEPKKVIKISPEDDMDFPPDNAA